MLRFALPLALLGSPAVAHVGHLGGMAGHDHWVAGIAIGVAVGVGLWGALKGKSDEDPETEEDDIDAEEETA